MPSPRKPKSIGPKSQICCLAGKAEWTSPEDGQPCKSMAHGHLTYAKAVELVEDEKAEWVSGIRHVYKVKTRELTPEACWIPVIRFQNARTWRKKLSCDGKSAVATMQLVAGG